MTEDTDNIEKMLDQNLTLLTDYPLYLDYLISLEIWRFGCPFWLLVGSVLNCLSINIFLHPRNRHQPLFVFLTALSCTDLLGLWTSIVPEWLIIIYDFHMEVYSLTGCRVFVFLERFPLECSSWLMVALTTERVYTEAFPGRSKAICSQAYACIVVTTIASVFFLLNIYVSMCHSVRVYYYDNETYVNNCENFASPDDIISNNNLFYLIEFLLITAMPALHLSASNLFLIYKSKRYFKMQDFKAIKQGKLVNKTGLTSIVIWANFLFLFCNIPSRVYNYFAYEKGKQMLLHALFFLLSFSSNIFNFFVYYVRCSRFRKLFRETV